MESPSLFFAVLSMAAEDLASQLNDASIPNEFSRDSKIYCERAMRLLTSEFANELTTDSVRPLNSRSITSALAATLVLCNLEIKQLHSTSWQVHLRAARAVIHRCTIVNRPPSSTSVMNAFLIHKFFSINVSASMSTFSDTHDLLGDTLGDECNSLFLEFLRIMQQITYDQRNPREFPYHRIPNCDELRARLIRARTTALLSIDRKTLPYVGWFQPYSGWIGVCGMVITVTCYGYTTFLPGSWDTGTFFFYYTMLLLAPLTFGGWKIAKRTKFVRSSEADLVWDKPIIDAYETALVEETTGFWREIAQMLRLRKAKKDFQDI